MGVRPTELAQGWVRTRIRISKKPQVAIATTKDESEAPNESMGWEA